MRPLMVNEIGAIMAGSGRHGRTGICLPTVLRRSSRAPKARFFHSGDAGTYGRARGGSFGGAVPQDGKANAARPAARDLPPSGRVNLILRRPRHVR